ncbi:MAG: cytochrome c3 family protein [Deltaproteobacteria bacterium]|nr:cytochrome c3 family protein [Candidatus Tharpella sp.]
MKSRKRWALKVAIVALFFLAAPAFSAAGEPPASIQIDSLSKLYKGVEFDHEMHVGVEEDCSVCHHHVFGNGIADQQCARCHADSKATASIACKDCHVQKPFIANHLKTMEADPNRYHIDIPGLKGAYHLRCFNCHIEEGAPTECSSCHERTDAGDRFYKSGRYAPAGGGGGNRHE